MVECSRCGVSDSQRRLVDAISNEGVVKICDVCLRTEGLPTLKKPKTEYYSPFAKKPEEKPSVYDRLSQMSGVKKRNSVKSETLKQQEASLKKVVDDAFVKHSKEELGKRNDLIDNFHWVVMRARRLKKLTQVQLAKEIEVSEEAVRLAERGKIPINSDTLIKKIEDCLGVRIVKEEFRQPEPASPPKELEFDTITTKTLTISDLKTMKQGEGENIFEKPSYSFNEEVLTKEGRDAPEFVDSELKEKKDLSKKEMDDLVFGRG